MSVFEAVLLGVIQGVAEFLPISSSAHLILVPFLLGYKESGISFDIALHFGTMLAVLFIFFKEWWGLFLDALSSIKNRQLNNGGRIFWHLIFSTIPAALTGVLFDDIIENIIRNKIWLIALALAIMGLLIFLGDKWASRHYRFEKNFMDISLKESFIIGCAQVFALIPGFSRSGTTILAGRILGISKEAITKFTFLLSVPVICGATILKISDLELSKVVITGILSSFIMGLVSIKFLLKYIKTHDFSVFAFYRVILSLVVFMKLVFLG